MSDMDPNGSLGEETIETISAAAGAEQQKMKIELDDSSTTSGYSSTVRVWGSAEEINLDFAGPLQPSGPQAAKLKIDHRVIMNPWAAKRLALSLNQAIARYEQAYGTLELDVRRRMVNPPMTQPAPSGKLS